MVSLDLARQNLALHGREFYAKTVEFADYARKEINAIGGYYAFGEELCDGKAFYAFDKTKLSVHTRAMGLAGIEVYDLLRDEYDIQIEFGDIGNILAMITGGDRALEIERLLGALETLIKKFHGKSPAGLYDHEYIDPILARCPRQAAFYAERGGLPIGETAGRVRSEFRHVLPAGDTDPGSGRASRPGYPGLYRVRGRQGDCALTGCRDMNVEYLQTVQFSAGNDTR